MVDVNRDELAYKSEVKLTGYCNAKNDKNNNLWVTMESPFLTKKITQKFPTLPGYTIPEIQTRAIGDNEIEITSNGNYILGQNDEDPDDLEMDIDNNNNNNNSKKLTLLKNQTRDNITSNFILGKININIPSPTVYPEITFNTITQNDTTYTLSQLTNDQSEYFSKNSKIKCKTKIIIDELYQDGGGSGIYNWTDKMRGSWKSTQTSLYLYQYQEMIYIHLDSKNKIWHIEWSSQNKGGYTKTFAANSYVVLGNYSNGYWLWFRNSAIPNVNLLSLYDPLPGLGEGSMSETLMELSTDYFDFAWPRT